MCDKIDCRLYVKFSRLIDSTVIEEPDTGDIGIITHLQIKEVCNSMPRVEDEHNYLEDKGGFWDLALLAVKFLHAKVHSTCNNY